MKKFYAVIGNPPYQEESQGESTGTNPIYHMFYDATISVADKVELITPARFLFNAGKTPKAWNEKMLSDKHFRVLRYEQDPNKVFSDIPITGGVAISYWDKNADFEPIGTFVPYDELRSVITKVKQNNFTSIRDIIFVHSKFNLEEMYRRDSNFQNLVGSDGKDRRVRANAMEVFPFFTDKPVKEDDVRVLGIIS